jgi:uncharacterized protein YndB with AHSA1/START domain
MNPGANDLTANDLTIVRTFDAPAALVFSMWSDPAHFAAWIGPQGFTCPIVELDFRVGGAYRALITSNEAGENWFSGVYRDIVRHTDLAFTFTWNNTGPLADTETLITITFQERDGRTTQTFHQGPFPDEDRRDSHREGWDSAFDKLSAYVAAQAEKKETSA